MLDNVDQLLLSGGISLIDRFDFGDAIPLHELGNVSIQYPRNESGGEAGIASGDMILFKENNFFSSFMQVICRQHTS
ncbi:MAG: hypothetical protein ACD_41C00308G0001 [uncultured bacterium]|nr:MAG: hypothetical protein ACD_41C00308G0001 [uncultured bacterium]